ncbi:MAG: hypothetical protein LBQ60_06705 [Bacteroidales bacterium]|jgi:ligand-binding sensor domain-containing protein/signal transduction histidine kinase|nr:hypothetical protein [Bacteroidales bacterium]
MRINSDKIRLGLFIILIGTSGLSADGYSETSSVSKTDYYTFFKTISTKNGLSSDFVLDVIQDKYHIMWFATADGLTRFDNREFAVYRNQKESEHTISDNFVSCLAEDTYGNIWVGTRNGLNRYDRNANSFIRYQQQSTGNNLPGDNHIMALYADNDGYLWVKSKEGYLSRLDIRTDTWTYFNVIAREFEGDYFYDYITGDSGENLWASGRNTATKIIRHDSNGHLLIKEVEFAPEVTTAETSFAVENNGTVYFANNNGQLLAYDPKSGMIEYIKNTGIAVRAGTCDQNGNLWIGGKTGIKVLNLHTWEETVFRHHPVNSFSLPSDEIHCLYMDHDGGIWIGTDNGIAYYSDDLNIMRHYRHIEGLRTGLASNNVTALLQDRDGLIWVGTAGNGVDTMSLAAEEFGNLTYRLLTNDLNEETFKREKETLQQYFRHKYITSPDKGATEQTIFSSFNSFQQGGLSFNKTNENRVSSLYEDKNGNIYIGLWAHVGFNVYDKKRNRFKRYALWSKAADNSYPRIFEGNPFGANWYSGFLEDNDGNFWCATWEAFGLNLFNRERGKFDPKHYMPGHLPGKEIARLTYDPVRERIVIGGTYYYGYYDIKSGTYVRYAGKLPAVYPNRDIFEGYFGFCDVRFVDLPLQFTVTDYIMQDDVVLLSLGDIIVRHDLLTDRFEILAGFDGGWTILSGSPGGHSLWVGTKNKLRNVGIGYHKVHTVAETDSCSILSLYEDTTGIVWIGTDKGLLFYDPGKKTLSLDGTDLTMVGTIVPFGETVYVGCAQGIIKFENREKVKKYSFGYPETEGIPGTRISNIYPARDGKLWISTNGGLAAINPQTDEIAVFTHDPKDRFSLTGNNIYSVCEDGKSNLWVSTTNGICLLEQETERFIDLSQPDDRTLTSRLTSCIMQDASGKIWIGTTQNGISVLDPRTDRLKHYIRHEWDEKSLSDNYINCIFEDSRRNIWIGTRKGLDRYDQAEDNMARVDGFTGLQVMNIQEDNSGNIWCSTNKGLLYMSPSSGSICMIQDFPGMQGNEFGKAGTKLDNGSLAFGGKYGFNIFDPTRLTEPVVSKPVVLSHFTVNGLLRYFDLNERKDIELKHRDNSFAVSFTTTDYEYGNLIKYRYQLEGFDRNWIYTDLPDLTAKYTNIPFGRYSFIVEASDRFGQWHDAGSELRIRIIAPWYFRWWAVFIYLLLMSGAIILIVRIREYRLRKDNMRLETIVEQRTRELQETNRKLVASEDELRAMNDSKNKFFGIISHDLRNPLKALNLTTRSLYEQYDSLNEEDKQRIIRTIYESADQAGTLLENLLLWVVSQMDLLHPNLQKTNLSALTDSNIDFSSVTANKKGIHIINRIPGDIDVWADTNLSSTILRNLISNAIHFSYPGSDIIISAKEKNEMVEISVSDHGIGIRQEDLERLFLLNAKIRTKGTGNEQGTGLGLIVTREFVHLQGGEIYVESIENKQTIFTFTLKKYEE